MKPEKKPAEPLPEADSEIGMQGSAKEDWTTECDYVLLDMV
jgi:hypothetical protein